jgi:hypothetical protein
MLRYWWLIIFFMFGGALIGWLSLGYRTPLYQSQAVITVSIDFTQTGELTDIEQDLILVAAGDVIKSTQVIEAVVSAAEEWGIDVSISGFNESRHLERAYGRWLLILRHRDAETASSLANIWAETAYDAIGDAYEHALIADGLQNYQDTLSSCLEQATAEMNDSICSDLSLDEMQAEIERTSKVIREEREASLGILPATTFAFTEQAETPDKVILYVSNTLIFFGAVIGFILAVWLIYLDPPGK